ncbi:hypothetical protein PIB30_075833 [Stylosanthes scabra]|uniref:Uncharacterized protein n=1 Tax=Stylosanthes scabra TaxID=79078 RepID=A0ABU6XRX0_9FABA|nr:hypothetical protein [Stylosanthes scabra]
MTPEDLHRKTIRDQLASSGYMAISTKASYDIDQKPLLSVVQEGEYHNFVDSTIYGLQEKLEGNNTPRRAVTGVRNNTPRRDNSE